jgi:AraC-like DNA-binding protein
MSPPDYLKPYVRYFWTLESNASGDSSTMFNAIADGCPGIVFQQISGTAFFDSNHKKLPGCFLYGQATTNRALYTQQHFRQIGVYFYPDALRTVFGIDAGELTDTCADINSVSRVKPFDLPERLLNTTNGTEQIQVLSSYLFGLIRRNDATVDTTTRQIAARILREKGSVALKTIQDDLGVSERSLERKFKQHIGISPKLFSRISRFQASLGQLRNSSYEKLSDIAFENGYADQSHFIRAFKEFTGSAPHQFQKQSNEVVENFPVLNSTSPVSRQYPHTSA